jgi:hypothetical protein
VVVAQREIAELHAVLLWIAPRNLADAPALHRETKRRAASTFSEQQMQPVPAAAFVAVALALATPAAALAQGLTIYPYNQPPPSPDRLPPGAGVAGQVIPYGTSTAPAYYTGPDDPNMPPLAIGGGGEESNGGPGLGGGRGAAGLGER